MPKDLNIRKELKQAGELMIKGWGDELIAQGYKFTGRLINSLEAKIIKMPGEWRIDFYVESYGIIRDRGVKGSRIPYTPGQRIAQRSKFIESLLRWVKRKLRLRGRAAKSATFRIAAVQSREGSPTRGSFRFSSNNRRRGWIQAGANRSLKELDFLLERLVGRQVELTVDSLFAESMSLAA